MKALEAYWTGLALNKSENSDKGMKLDFFQRKFWTASRQCAAPGGKCTISCDNEDIKCYLIDNDGFILVTEDYSQTGLFFG
ncbi:unnamed protein product [Coregonus sp. 'balchen']|nr:unnamed protein product [Coregonus sp. 'balchen']